MNTAELRQRLQDTVEALGDVLAARQDARARDRGWQVARTPWGGRVYRDQRFVARKAARPLVEVTARHADAGEVPGMTTDAGLASVPQLDIDGLQWVAGERATAHPGVEAGWAVNVFCRDAHEATSSLTGDGKQPRCAACLKEHSRD